MKTSEYISSICKFAEPKAVVDYPPMEFLNLKKAIEYLKKEVVLPHGIEHWDKAKIKAYLDKTLEKKSHIEDWIFEKRHILREPHYKDLQEAFILLQKRWDQKVQKLTTLLQQP